MLKEQVSIIPPEPPVRYFYKQIGIEYDFKVEAALEAMCKSPESQRLDTIRTMDSRERAVLSAFSIRAASLAVRSKSSAFLRTGIVSVIFRNFDSDPNYGFIALAVLRDAANRIGADFNTLLIEATRFGTSEAREIALSFVPNMATLEQMSYAYVDDGENSRYLPKLS